MLGKRLINTGSAATPSVPCTTNTLQVLGDNSCVAYYKMSDATDESGNYDGTPSNVNFNVAGKFGNAGEFNGTNSTIATPITTNYSNLSISCWVKFNALPTGGADATLVSKGFYTSGGSNQYLHLRYEDNLSKGFTFAIRNNSAYNSQAIAGVNAIIGVWYHVVGTLDSSGNAQIYVNGAAGTGITGAPSMTNSNDFEIGSFISTSALLNGSIDQIRIFNKALSSSEVTTLYDEVYCVPTIVPTANFNPVLYNGTGTTNARTDVGFKPDLVWIKSRGRGNPFTHRLTDSVRGVQKQISSDTTDIEATENGVMSFDTAGFTLGDAAGFNIAASPNTFVAWNWKAGGAAVSNTDGTITSQVSANVDAGFSIVKYTGNGSTTATIGTGLDKKVELVLIKNIDQSTVWSAVQLPEQAVGNLNNSNAMTFSYYLGNTTSSVLGFTSQNNAWNQSSSNHIAYCFHSVDGYSKIGSYTGISSGNINVSCGFRPAYIMIKATSATGHWEILDSKRSPTMDNSTGAAVRLRANDSSADANFNNSPVKFTSTGFYLDSSVTANSYGDYDKNGVTYTFMAFAEEVFNPNGVTRNATNPFGDASELALYKFEDNTTDSEGTYGTASNSGVSYISSGYIDKSISFTGTTSTVNTTIPNGHTQTWSFWAKIPNSFTGDRIISALNSSGDAGQAITYSSSSNFYIYDYIGGASVNAITVAWANDGGWHHFAFSKNATTSVIYVDGSKLATLNAYSGNFQTGNNITFGKGLYGNALVGLQLDQVRIFNRALDSGEITQLYNE